MTDLRAKIERSDLIAELEQATEGSRELSNEIAEAVGWQRDDARQFVWRSPDGQAYHVAPDFSRRLDAAISLVPDGMTVHVWGNGACWKSQIEAPGAIPKFFANFDAERQTWNIKKTAALALCIAAMKAQAAAPTLADRLKEEK